ncbi:phosphoribosylformylglycinamidine synthase subunit PurL, partial [bacterium]|nr:phosphoribosylformylglycinamidine synthase subunit PurL [bacterium]
GKIVADVPADSLVLGGGAPRYKRPSSKPFELEIHERFNPDHVPEPTDYTKVLTKLLASPNIASKRWVFEQYDHTIGANTMVGPGLSDAAVIRVPGTQKALVLTVDGNGKRVALNPRRGAKLAVCEAALNVACTGGRPIGLTNCLNFGNPMNEEIYYFFREAVAGMGEACRALEIPVTGGNVSFYNESENKAVMPTPVIGMVGLLEDFSLATPMGFQEEGDFIALLGTQGKDLGGSEYLHLFHDLISGPVPETDFERHKALIQLLKYLSDNHLIRSAHDISDGGLAVCLAEACMPNSLGAVLTFPWDLRPVKTLFAENVSCVVISVNGDLWGKFRDACKRFDIPVKMLGRVGGEDIAINDWLVLSVKEAEEIYENTLPNIMEQVEEFSV